MKPYVVRTPLGLLLYMPTTKPEARQEFRFEREGNHPSLIRWRREANFDRIITGNAYAAFLGKPYDRHIGTAEGTGGRQGRGVG